MIIGLGMQARLLNCLELSAKVLAYHAHLSGVCGGWVHRWCTDLVWEHLQLSLELALQLAYL